VVATPIGNLRDITLRALEILKSAHIVAAEDTRNTSHLLGHFGISAKLMALHEHNEQVAAPKIIAALQSGKTVALVSDAGTPAVSDRARSWCGRCARRACPWCRCPAPAPSSARFPLRVWMRRISFLRLPACQTSKPAQGAGPLLPLPYTLAFYEAPHRIVETVADLLAVLGGEREIVFARELTKVFESIHGCKLADAPAWLAGDPNRQRGEFVLLVSGAPPVEETGISVEAQRVLTLLLADLPLKQAVQLAPRSAGRRKMPYMTWRCS